MAVTKYCVRVCGLHVYSGDLYENGVRTEIRAKKQARFTVTYDLLEHRLSPWSAYATEFLLRTCDTLFPIRVFVHF